GRSLSSQRGPPTAAAGRGGGRLFGLRCGRGFAAQGGPSPAAGRSGGRLFGLRCGRGFAAQGGPSPAAAGRRLRLGCPWGGSFGRSLSSQRGPSPAAAGRSGGRLFGLGSGSGPLAGRFGLGGEVAGSLWHGSVSVPDVL
ncbi:MAG TPA: hypothetical protein VKL22_05320, partial [Actinomycetota bacterium]|nr:hypothetical protein [Actinomycetota bacterium]